MPSPIVVTKLLADNPAGVTANEVDVPVKASPVVANSTIPFTVVLASDGAEPKSV